MPQLVALSIGCGLIWRIEVEIGGWAGLQWINYPHAAIPVGVCAFLTWVWLTLSHSKPQRLRIVAIAGVWFVIGGSAIRMLAESYFGGPGYLWKPLLELIFKDFSNENYKAGWEFYTRYRWLTVAAWILFPLPLFYSYSCFLGLSKKRWIKPLALWIGTWHLGWLVISVFPDKGSADLIHSLKTGWMIPFAVFALGWPIAEHTAKQRKAS